MVWAKGISFPIICASFFCVPGYQGLAGPAFSEAEFRTILDRPICRHGCFQKPQLYLFTLALNLPEHLKVTTLRADSIKSEPVAGLRPRR
jgi:hypothetical protein